MEMDDGDDDEAHIIQQMMAHNLVMMAMARQLILESSSSDDDSLDTIDHRTLARGARKVYRHAEALKCIRRDYLGGIDGQAPLLGAQFKEMFRISLRRFERFAQSVVPSNIFFQGETDCFNRPVPSWQAKLLLPLKTLAYGVASHTFRDYFQMSKTEARECLLQFVRTVKDCFSGEYLRCPTSQDMESIVALHKHGKHKIPGMLGSLDCMHMLWKNCPKAYAGQFKGKEKKPTVVLEAACDYNLWFWHASFGHPGSLNDINILNLSPLLDAFLDGTFADRERSAVPYAIADEMFNSLYFLADGIYPSYSRFVLTINQPILERERYFAAWQEGARKDIERAFGVLQCQWKFVANPIHHMNPVVIGDVACACLIFHNMNVEDRVMGNSGDPYDPKVGIGQDEYIADEPIQQGGAAVIGVANGAEAMQNAFVGRWAALANTEEHIRLRSAIMRSLQNRGNNNNN